MGQNNLSISFIILAAGKGSRMNSNLPKVLHQVAGRSLIEHILHTISVYNAKIHCVVPNSNNQIADYLKSNGVKASFHKQVQQLGTADAVKTAVTSGGINEDITVILYGDTPFISADLIDDLIIKIQSGFAATVVGFEYDEANKYGKLITKNDKLLEIVEAIELGAANDDYNLCNSGIMAFKTSALKSVIHKINNDNKKGEYYLTDALGLLNDANQKVGFVVCDYNEVLGINDPLELAYAEEVFQINKISELLLNSVKVIKGESSYFSADCEIEKSAIIEPNCYIGKNTKIKSGCHIKAFSYIEDSVVGKNTKIGPFAHLRAGVEIAKDCRIGNFVEVKKSQLGNNSKAAHLSYIGDSEIGQNVNIGAGTITCNYDGKNKHKTTIEDNVFVGSNSALVAPVTIAKDALIGAGSVVTKNVPEANLAVARAKQVNIAKKNNG
jgi:bifunctional UDP-N-acetylglucosamine pyrophosphorylase/glucosamine-1-phosphate N-acetyltransferase